MLTLEQAREALRLDNTDNDDIITGLLAAIPDYIELCTGIPAEAQKTEPLADTAGKFILTLWYHAERVDADKIQRTIDSLLKTLQLFQSTRPIRGATAKMHNLCSAFLQQQTIKA